MMHIQPRMPSTSVSMSALKQVPYSMPMPGMVIVPNTRKKQQNVLNNAAAVSTLNSLQQH